MRRRAFAASAAAAFLAGCQQSRQRVIAVIPKATSHLFWVAVQSGAFAAERELKIKVIWNGPTSETDYARQIQILDSMVAQRVDGIAIAACERQALVGPVERAIAAGIPVTVFDSGLDSDKYLSFVATNNYEGGQMAAREMAALLKAKPKAKVAVLQHTPGSQSTMDREKGFEDTVAQEFAAQIQIVARQYGMSDRSKSRAAAENFLTAHPDLDGIFCSTEPSATGAALALKSREVAGKVKFVAFDSSEGMVEDLRGGVIHALVVQDPYRMGFDAVKTLHDKLAGRQVAKRIDLSARVIRPADLDKPDVQRLLAPEKAR
ncbi:MAG: substrate-binding domain-containing protein [Bryobacteraceae bacterium]|nr:substrate-binding domain-containing protein [Bryobacteraceae bacterium]